MIQRRCTTHVKTCSASTASALETARFIILLTLAACLLPCCFCIPFELPHSCVFDLPFFFCRGADRMRVLSNGLAFAFDRVEARPKVVNLQLVNAKVPQGV